jgi:hypothetical protein
MQLQGR